MAQQMIEDFKVKRQTRIIKADLDRILKEVAETLEFIQQLKENVEAINSEGKYTGDEYLTRLFWLNENLREDIKKSLKRVSGHTDA
jgi:Asp-tRNA(Asn)/Glu-tRNA(Gln) amidotransferase C subunit